MGIRPPPTLLRGDLAMPIVPPCRTPFLCVCLLLGFAGDACITPAAEPFPRPNVLLLLADDQRADTIAALGNRLIETPNLDALVNRGLVFRRATCSYPICYVSRAEIFSGCHGWENGVDGVTQNEPRQDLVSWAEAFQASGYQTAYVGKWHTRGRPDAFGFERTFGLFGSGGGRWQTSGRTDWKGFPITGYRGWVFQSLDGREKFPEQGVGLTPAIDARFADAALEALDTFAQQEQPWLLHVNFTAPHDPLLMPPGRQGKYLATEMPLPVNFLPQHPFDHGNLRGRDETLMSFPRTPTQTRDVLRLYYSVIDHLDQQVGRILHRLRALNQLERTIVIYSSDHGMAVGSHGLRGKQNMYEHTINVPLVIAGPGIPQGQQSEAQVYLRELFPTSCELCDIAIPTTVTADSFATIARGKQQTHHEEIFGYYTDSQRMIRRGRWKYILYPRAEREQLFDLTNDPHERHNLADDPAHAERREQLAEALQTWRQREGDPMLRAGSQP